MEYFAHESAFIDEGCKIGKGTKIWHFSHIMANCILGENCNIGQNVVISPEVAHVGKGASIGANATIVCGHDIGEYAFIGAGAVVTKNVQQYSLWVGNPAKQMGWISEFGHRLQFDKEGIAICFESNEMYKLDNESVKKL
ncbi:MAG: acyltransferase [Bacteroidetes bacterium]|nr:acyltransferase [Bacteroidota bacterium]